MQKFLLVAAGLGITACSRSANTTNGASLASTDPPTRVARLTGLQGNVSLQQRGDSAWSDAAENYSVTTGDRIYTEQNGRAELDLGSAAVRLAPASDVTVRNLTNHFLQVGLNQGTLRASVYKQTAPDSMEIDTPNGALIPKGTGNYRVSIQQNGNVDPTYVTVDNGAIEVAGPGVDQVVNAGQTVELSGSNPIQITTLTPGATATVTPAPSGQDLSSFDQWSTNRDMLYAPTSPVTQYVNPTTPGWEDLVSAVGNWLTNSQYGPVWQPTNVASSWTPYQDGQWTWVEPYGWTYVSNQPWGFTPFHYGRWVDLSNGWAWVPGPVNTQPVYAPALVAFTDPNALGVTVAPDAQAYFPLAPNEPYIPWYHVSDDYVRALNLADLRNVSDIGALIAPERVAQMRWMNPGKALVVLPASAFANGEPIERAMIHVNPARADFVKWEPHPTVNPGPPAFAVARGLRRNEAGGEVMPPGRGFGPPPERALVSRAAPPAARVPFEAQRSALEAHPGRPLEPRQIENIRAGRPAGPMHDVEIPHRQPAPVAPAAPRRMPQMQGPSAAPMHGNPAQPPRGNEQPHGNPGGGGGGRPGGPPAGKPGGGGRGRGKP